jgi:pSer/pThr/pTyr-binding forkhead associated (FHA) protein
MREIILYIEAPDGTRQRVALENEITIGRTRLAQIAIDDAQLSRVHTTVWREGDDVWIQDENSTNGTFVNGERIAGERKLNEGDEILLGGETRISVEIFNSAQREMRNAESKTNSAVPPIGKAQTNIPQPATGNPQSKKIPTVPLVAGLGIFAIVFFTLIALLLANSLGGSGSGNYGSSNNGNPTPVTAIRSGVLIPVRVVDPLGGEDPEELDDLIALFEVEEKELKAEDLSEVKSTAADDATKPSELNVPIAFWQKQKDAVFAPRVGVTGISPPGMEVPPELRGDGVVKQKAKLAEMMRGGYQQPMDFAELAQKRLSKELVELPMATESFLIEVGGSAGEGDFTAFSFQTGNTPLAPGSPKFQPLQELANNFDGQKYDLSNGRDRKQIRIRLLRMFHPRARPILKELADAYFQEFKRPLRVTSLTRSMDYQISLNKTNANSFIVRGPGSLPPHTSGCAFDLGRAYMTVKEQNFVMKKLAEMENRGVLDALIEYNVNACWHVFIYPDGKPPKM